MMHYSPRAFNAACVWVGTGKGLLISSHIAVVVVNLSDGCMDGMEWNFGGERKGNVTKFTL